MKMTHQATANSFTLGVRCSTCCFPGTKVSAAERFYFSDVPTPCVKIMTNYSAVAWSIKKNNKSAT